MSFDTVLALKFEAEFGAKLADVMVWLKCNNCVRERETEPLECPYCGEEWVEE